MVATRDSTRHSGTYVCGPHWYKGNAGCTNNVRIKTTTLEKALLKEIEARFADALTIDRLVSQLNTKVRSQIVLHQTTVRSMEKQVADLNNKIDNMFSAYEDGLDPDLCKERLERLKSERTGLLKSVDEARNRTLQPLVLDAQKARDLFFNLKSLYNAGTNEQKRLLFRTYIRRLAFDPQTRQITIVFYPFYLQESIKRGTEASRYITYGAGGGNRTRTGQGPEDFKSPSSTCSDTPARYRIRRGI